MEQVIEHIFCIYGRAYSFLQPWFVEKEYNKVLEHLYISNFASACNASAMKQQGFTHVISLIPGVPPMFPDDFQYLLVEVRDRSHVQIRDHFQRCIEFIEQAHRSGGKVLVHCLKGVSRSATIVCAYLIANYKHSPASALSYLIAIRPIVNPNPGFYDQLNTLYVLQTQTTQETQTQKTRRSSV